MQNLACCLMVALALSLCAQATEFDLKVTDLVVSKSGKVMPDYSQVMLGEKFNIRVTVRNVGPGRSTPAYIYYAICKASHKVVKADVPIPALAPGQSLTREFTTSVNEAQGLWVVEGDVEVASPPDRDHYNNHMGLYHLRVLHPTAPPKHHQGGE